MLLPVFAFNAIVNAGTKAQGTDVILYFGGPHSMLSSQHTPCHFNIRYRLGLDIYSLIHKYETASNFNQLSQNLSSFGLFE